MKFGGMGSLVYLLFSEEGLKAMVSYRTWRSEMSRSSRYKMDRYAEQLCTRTLQIVYNEIPVVAAKIFSDDGRKQETKKERQLILTESMEHRDWHNPHSRYRHA